MIVLLHLLRFDYPQLLWLSKPPQVPAGYQLREDDSLKHPYIRQTMIEHTERPWPTWVTSNRIAVAIEDGDIFSSEYMDETLQARNDEVFFPSRVFESLQLYLARSGRPMFAWTEVTEYGFRRRAGGQIVRRI